MTDDHFLTRDRIYNGPWQAFERDVARLLLHNYFFDVRVVGRSGDKGADILANNDSGLFVIQCKHTTTSSPPKDALDEVVEAGQFYSADHLVVACSRPPGDTFLRKRDEYKRLGLDIKIWSPFQLLKLAEQATLFSVNFKELRPYQLDSVNKFRDSLVDSGRAQMILATGLGKTVVMSTVVQDMFDSCSLENRRVLVIAHMKDLVTQLHYGFLSQISKNIPTHQLSDGEFPTFWEGITFATFQSVISRINELPKFDLILVDEAHHIGAETFRDALCDLAPKMLGGATATPWRGDGFIIDELLGPPVVRIGIDEGLAKGFLSEVDYRLLADNIDWEFVRSISQHNYSLSQLNRKLILPTRDERAAQLISELYKSERRKTGIIFCPSIVHARHFSSFLREVGLTCEIIASEVDPRECNIRLTKFRKGEYQFALTIDMFNEGVDVPDVDMIVFMRSTHSRRIFIQQLGRGLRISPNKDKVLVLDFVSDLKRMAEVLDLDSAVRTQEVEKLGLGRHLVEFSDRGAGSLLQEWLLDQADLILNDSPRLELPRFNYPSSNPTGGFP